MRTIISFFTIITLVSCRFDNLLNDNYIQPELDSIVTEYIKKYPNDSIYSLYFYQFNNKQFFNIWCSGTHYDSRFVDICFPKNNKLIVACSINNSLMDSLISISESNQCLNSLKKYNDWNDDADRSYDYDSHVENYRILGSKNYRIADVSDFEQVDSAHDCNVIKSQAINNVLNNFLNSCRTDIAYLRFDSINKSDYMTIGNDYVYDKDAFSGMFYRDGRIVVLYDYDKIMNQGIIDKSQLLPISELKYYKAIKRTQAKFMESKFKIKSEEEIVDTSPHF